MPVKTLLDKPALTHEKSLKTLVENRTIFSLDHCELNIFETYQKSELVPLKFNDLVVSSMLRGKKVMHLFEDPSFDYLPGETVIVPGNAEMKIDFPEATKTNPTQCIALAIDHTIIQSTLDFLNEKYPKEGRNNLWKLDHENYFFYNNVELAGTINKLIKECMGDSLTKDAIADLTLQELIIRIIQTQTSKRYEEDQYINISSPIAPVIECIKSNIHQTINLKDLSDKACMSPTSFYRYFKRELGMSPIEFILNEKIKYAKKLLSNPKININEVSYATGFEDCNYFIRLFKKYEGVTPKQYQLMNFTMPYSKEL
ncbi:MAG: helix-turn-helix domain-containing protein [Flavobacterium sp.]|jgi:AraC-like DNA-binding protein|uniref:AraC family transcriptional regulator n=1 Tax=Flavobacterium sp. TaxID=239 RepID=UPI0022CA087E|nr:AraC family transcriptional regulator [Flavobacterium sp.]MCZ8169076.1 AraC family transcriptional regulator [Flavobacterium sp.]MCZ8297145.1 AraC family transcriptional regulator [Flavobacterium sp.]